MDQLLAIRAFARVVEAGTFTRAAESMNMPNATLTKLVQSLETHLGVKLLHRTTRRVTVTPDGAQYYEQTGPLLKELEDIDSGFSVAQGKPRGHLRVDCGGLSATMLVLPALPEFLAQYPDIRIDFGVSDRNVDLVGDNVDCVIRGGTLNDSTMVGRRIASAAWVTCATPAYLDAHGVPAHPRELEEGSHKLIHYRSASNNRVAPMRFERDGEKIEIKAPGAIGVNESNAHLVAGLMGLGVCQTFAFAAAPAIARGELVPILREWQPKAMDFHVVYSSNRHMSRRLRVFIEWVAESFARRALDGDAGWDAMADQ
jgi:LysR family transcriptional regulator for bpeEF and oprC